MSFRARFGDHVGSPRAGGPHNGTAGRHETPGCGVRYHGLVAGPSLVGTAGRPPALDGPFEAALLTRE